jgi:hypothetical protein
MVEWNRSTHDDDGYSYVFCLHFKHVCDVFLCFGW